MKTLLNGAWEVTCFEGVKQVQVPGVLEQYLDVKNKEGSYVYNREFTLQKKDGQRYFLHCEGISCAASIHLNDHLVGEVEGIWTGHELEITEFVEENNTIKVQVEKPSFQKEDRYYYRSVLFGFIPDVLFPFSGIFKDIYVEERPAIHLQDIQVYFDYDHEELVMESKLEEEGYEISFELEGQPEYKMPYASELRVKLQDIRYWSPEHPQCYHIQIALWKDTTCIQKESRVLGYRTIRVENDQILLNGAPMHFRGILHWGYYPENYQVIPDKETIKKELIAIREQGFNAIKFCLFLPQPEYYALCDELGMLVWQELPLWLPYDNGYLFPRIFEQYPKMMSEIRHHPSLCMISIGCELDQTIPKETLDALYDQITGLRTQAIVCDNSGSGECYDGALHSESDIYDYHFYGELHRMQQLIHEFKHSSRLAKPWFFGEFNDMDTFRDLTDVKANSDYELFWANPDPTQNLLRQVHANAVSDMPIYEYETIVEENELAQDQEQLLACANQKGYDVRKYNLETTRKNDVTGYSITAIRDVPITSCGIFDDFQQKKWSDEAMQRINGDIVLSMSAPLKRKWHNGADVFLSLDEYNFYENTRIANRIHVSNHTAKAGEATVCIKLAGESVWYEEEKPVVLEAYGCKELLPLDIVLPSVTTATRVSLEVSIVQDEVIANNQWDIWVYPKKENHVQLYDPTNVFEGIEDVMKVKHIHEFNEVDGSQVLVTTVLNDAILNMLPEQQSVIYVQNGEGYFPLTREPFWRECVRLIKKNTFFDRLASKGYDSLQFISLTSDMGVLPKDITAKTATYQRIMSRIDNRRFHRSECVFQFEKAGHHILTTTLQFGRTSGTQARSFAENVFAQAVLCEMIQQQESTYETNKQCI